MFYKRANLKDLEDIMVLVKDAQNYLKLQKVEQWQDGYPNQEVITADILHNDSYIFGINDNETDTSADIILEEIMTFYESSKLLKTIGAKIIAYVSFSTQLENSYEKIYNGEWLTHSNNYGTIHRTIVSSKYRGKGLSKKLFELCEELAKEKKLESVRVDTHEDNKLMRYLIEKNGYKYCGWIYLTRNIQKRVVYEKIIK